MSIDPRLLAWHARLAGEFGTIARPDAKGRRERYLAISTRLREPDPVGVPRGFARLGVVCDAARRELDVALVALRDAMA